MDNVLVICLEDPGYKNSVIHLPITTVRAIVSLLAEVGGVEVSLEVKWHKLMNGLCELVGADYWAWSVASNVEAGKVPHFTIPYRGGFQDEQFQQFLVALDHPDMAELTAPFIAQFTENREHLTLTGQQFDPELKLLTSEAGKLWAEAGVGPTVLSWYPLPEGGISGIGVYRAIGKQLFNDDEATIIHLLLTEVPWLHDQDWPKRQIREIPKLSQRCRTVLNLLLEGCSRKEISAHLHLSEHTVNDYVKQLYRFFDVQSQSQLLSKFRFANTKTTNSGG